MNIIFLDIDGVLVNRESLMKNSGLKAQGHPACVEALNKIIKESHADIVISSTWRFDGLDKMRSLLGRWGVNGFVLDCTPDLNRKEGNIWLSANRGQEIEAWTKEKNINSFVILDDDSDMGPLKHRLVQTVFEKGLTLEDADKAIELFQQPMDMKSFITQAAMGTKA